MVVLGFYYYYVLFNGMSNTKKEKKCSLISYTLDSLFQQSVNSQQIFMLCHSKVLLNRFKEQFDMGISQYKNTYFLDGNKNRP